MSSIVLCLREDIREMDILHNQNKIKLNFLLYKNNNFTEGKGAL